MRSNAYTEGRFQIDLSSSIVNQNRGEHSTFALDK